jgi:hypothetical protein
MVVITALAGDNMALIQFMGSWQSENKEKCVKMGGLNKNVFSYFDLKLKQVELNNETSHGIFPRVRLRLERTFQRCCERVNHTVTLFTHAPLARIFNIKHVQFIAIIFQTASV